MQLRNPLGMLVMLLAIPVCFLGTLISSLGEKLCYIADELE